VNIIGGGLEIHESNGHHENHENYENHGNHGNYGMSFSIG
jgi:hypothetical protein